MNKKSLVFAVGLFFIMACTENYYPKPFGYFRIETGRHSYVPFSYNDVLSCSMPENSITEKGSGSMQKNWFNIAYPQLNASIYFSYLAVNQSSIKNAIDDSRRFAYRQLILAKNDSLSEQSYVNSEKQVYVTIYDIRGNVASPLQFTITNNKTHFFRGALYFDNKPNQDSIAPVLYHIREDVIKLIETVNWIN